MPEPGLEPKGPSGLVSLYQPSGLLTAAAAPVCGCQAGPDGAPGGTDPGLLLCGVPTHLGLFTPQNDGRLRLSRQGIIFKNSKTGKVDNIQAGELTEGIWRRVALGHGLKLLTKNGHVYKYDGFRESVRHPVAIAPS